MNWPNILFYFIYLNNLYWAPTYQAWVLTSHTKYFLTQIMFIIIKLYILSHTFVWALKQQEQMFKWSRNKHILFLS